MLFGMSEKKKAQHKKNLKHRLLFLHVSRMQVDAKHWGAPEFEPIRREHARRQADKVQGVAKLHMIRNKLDGRREMAKERWNRFAATGDAGGRGR